MAHRPWGWLLGVGTRSQLTLPLNGIENKQQRCNCARESGGGGVCVGNYAATFQNVRESHRNGESDGTLSVSVPSVKIVRDGDRLAVFVLA